MRDCPSEIKPDQTRSNPISSLIKKVWTRYVDPGQKNYLAIHTFLENGVLFDFPTTTLTRHSDQTESADCISFVAKPRQPP